MSVSFENQVAPVTGVGSGIGLATTKAFAKAGASMALANRSAARWRRFATRSNL
jgi:NADP-dependent 3-hydroxy acid dehydrogenase YdfG